MQQSPFIIEANEVKLLKSIQLFLYKFIIGHKNFINYALRFVPVNGAHILLSASLFKFQIVVFVIVALF